MNIKIYPSKVSGTITAPPSKSITHRAIIAASLANGKSVIKNALLSDDTKYTINALKQLGIKINIDETTLTIYGTNGKLYSPKKPINIGNSGSTMRLIAAIASLTDGTTILTGEERIKQRPMADLLNALTQIGVTAESIENNGCPPIRIWGGKLSGENIKIKGTISSQYISALLFIAPLATDTLTISIDGDLRSKPYVELTIDIMKKFGIKVINNNFKEFIIEKDQTYKPQNYIVEGDYSSASYFFAAAAITKEKITIKNLNINSAQGDKYLLEILKKMGCSIEIDPNKVSVKGLKNLSGLNVDMNDYPDIVQTLAVIAAYAKGETRIKNIAHLKDKETNRLTSTVNELLKMGINTHATDDEINIVGGQPKGTIINTYNDHRMAMSFAIAGLLATDETIIQNAEVVNKSYPNFWKDLKSIGAKIETI